jgi:hypothetical protein
MESLLIYSLEINNINNTIHQNTSGQAEHKESKSIFQADEPFNNCNCAQNSNYDNIDWNCIEDDNPILIDINGKIKRKTKTRACKITQRTEEYKKSRRNNTLSAKKSRLKTKMMELLRKAADAVPH